MMKDIKAIIFDCFGVLYVDVTEAYFSKFQNKREELHDLNNLCDHGFISRREYIAAVSNLTGDSLAQVEKMFQKEHVLNEPLIDLIVELKPHYKTGLLSNIGRDWINDFFTKHQLHDLFDAVILSAEEGITKPNPLIYERAAERLGQFTDECLFIDDSEKNCAGAEVVGMRAILYKDIHSIKQLLQ